MEIIITCGGDLRINTYVCYGVGGGGIELINACWGGGGGGGGEEPKN